MLEARLLGEGDWIAASEICQLCRLDLAAVMELAALGLVAQRELERRIRRLERLVGDY
jgi:hypothetical protein